MNDPASFAALAVSGLLALGLACGAGLKGWSEWLDLRRLQMEGSRTPRGRRELAELRARVRRLEAIADGEG